jgi:hypothetical protein
MRWNGKNYRAPGKKISVYPKPQNDIRELLKPLGEKTWKGNVWVPILNQPLNVLKVEEPAVSPTPTQTMTMTATPTMTVTPSSTPAATGTPTPTPTPSSTPPPAFDADAATFLAAVINSGGTVDATMSAATDTLFVGLKADGIYNKLTRMYPFIGGVDGSNRINALNPTVKNITFNGGWTHNASGSTPNGTTGYGTIGIIGAGGDALIGNNYHHSIYIGAAKTSANFEYDLGATIDPSLESILESTDYRYSRVSRADNAQEYQQPPSAVTGFFANSSDNPDFILQIRTTQTSRSFGIGSWVIPSINLLLGARNDNGSIMQYSTKQYSFLTIGERLSSTELSNLESRINTFQTSLSRNVY